MVYFGREYYLHKCCMLSVFSTIYNLLLGSSQNLHCLVFFFFMLYVVINCASLWSPFLVNVLLSLCSLLTGGTSGSRMICTSQTSHVLPGFAFQFALSKAGKEQRR